MSVSHQSVFTGYSSVCLSVVAASKPSTLPQKLIRNKGNSIGHVRQSELVFPTISYAILRSVAVFFREVHRAITNENDNPSLHDYNAEVRVARVSLGSQLSNSPPPSHSFSHHFLSTAPCTNILEMLKANTWTEMVIIVGIRDKGHLHIWGHTLMKLVEMDRSRDLRPQVTPLGWWEMVIGMPNISNVIMFLFSNVECQMTLVVIKTACVLDFEIRDNSCICLLQTCMHCWFSKWHLLST